MKTSISYIVTGNGNITAIVSGKTYVVPNDFPTYGEVRAAIKAADSAAFVSAVDMGEQLRNRSKGTVTLKDGVVTFEGYSINNVVTERIMAIVAAGLDVEPMKKFLENCLRNVESRAIDELYLFLEANSLPITEDGCLLAYRKVRADYSSIHANPNGTHNRNKIGDVVSMPPGLVDGDRNKTCSFGLHIASLAYMPHYGDSSNGDRIMIVKVNPKDIRAVPTDYANQKARCSEYTVVAEHVGGDNTEAFIAPVYMSCGTRPASPIAGRDARGRFTKKA